MTDTLLGDLASENNRLLAENAALRQQLEIERGRLAACGVAAFGYFTGCADEYKSASLDDILRLRQQLAECKDQVNQLNGIMRDKGFGQGEIDLMGWYEQQITLHECVHRQITANENLLRQQLTACQAECEEEARLNGAGGSREAALIAQIAEVQAQAIKDVNHFRRAAAESQAREKVLREHAAGALLIQYNGHAMYALTVHEHSRLICQPDSSTALDSAIRQAKREALLLAADTFEIVGGPRTSQLRRMAEEVGQAQQKPNEII